MRNSTSFVWFFKFYEGVFFFPSGGCDRLWGTVISGCVGRPATSFRVKGGTNQINHGSTREGYIRSVWDDAPIGSLEPHTSLRSNVRRGQLCKQYPTET